MRIPMDEGHHDAEHGEDALDTRLERAAILLRAEVVPSPRWRARVLDAVARPDERGIAMPDARRALALTWPRAIAAALLCMVVGAATMLAFVSRTGAGSRATAAAPATLAAAPPAGTTRFVFVAPGARHVSLVGDFNLWDAQGMPMQRLAGTDAWAIDVALPPGRHVYAFVVDGDLTTDPAAPRAGGDDFGLPSSVVVVSPRT